MSATGAAPGADLIGDEIIRAVSFIAALLEQKAVMEPAARGRAAGRPVY
jgi:hypothetical protein